MKPHRRLSGQPPYRTGSTTARWRQNLYQQKDSERTGSHRESVTVTLTVTVCQCGRRCMPGGAGNCANHETVTA